MMWLEGRVCGLCWTALMSKYGIYIASGLVLSASNKVYQRRYWTKLEMGKVTYYGYKGTDPWQVFPGGMEHLQATSSS